MSQKKDEPQTLKPRKQPRYSRVSIINFFPPEPAKPVNVSSPPQAPNLEPYKRSQG